MAIDRFVKADSLPTNTGMQIDDFPVKESKIL